MTDGQSARSAPDRPTGVRRLTETDIGPAADIIARAFRADPASIYLVRDEGKRVETLAPFFASNVRASLGDGLALGVDGPAGLQAVLLATPPRHAAEAAPARSQAVPPTEAVAATTTTTTSADGMVELIPPFLEAMHDLAAAALPPTHWYLEFLATDPGQHGRGLGSALVAEFHRVVDSERVVAGLLTFKPENVGFYGRRGYRVTGVHDFAEGGFSMWAMTRDPVLASPARP